MNCVNCSLDNLINYIVNKYNINRKTAIAVYYKLRNQVKNKLFCETDECNRRILKEYISKNRFYKFFNNLTNCYLDLIIDNVLELCEVEERPEPELGLRLTYLGGEFPETDLAGWNTKFDLPANGTAFTDMVVDGNEVTLIGGSGITLKSSLFRNDAKLLKIEDDIDCVVEITGGKFLGALSSCSNLTTVTLNGVITAGILALEGNAALTTLNMDVLTSAGNSCFKGCTSVTTFSFPLLTSAGNSCFKDCTAATTFDLSSCTALGTTAGDDIVFNSIGGNTIAVTIPIAQQTIDGGNPDGDLVYLAANNTATITYI